MMSERDTALPALMGSGGCEGDDSRGFDQAMKGLIWASRSSQSSE